VIDKAGYLSGSALTLYLSILSYRIVSYRIVSNDIKLQRSVFAKIVGF